MSLFSITIATPEGKMFSGEISSCTATGVNGKFQVLTNHAPLISMIDVGKMKIELENKKTDYLATSGGFLEIENNEMNVVVETAEWAKNIDLDRAKSAKERAEKRLAQKDNIDIARASASLIRAINRIDVAAKT
ncbi:MAG: ATP synthase F1 subunit epsilon [Calditrichia bacterium]|nr:ATP synthase F1 subunit epsilon [Calditrichia bacterium]